jgi:hypothetical protein
MFLKRYAIQNARWRENRRRPGARAIREARRAGI